MAKRGNIGGKREKLVEAAAALAHQQGYRKTTLADVAEESGVPLGNVYYYFRTKSDLGEAILAHRGMQSSAQQEAFDRLPDPKARLLAFVEATVASGPVVAQNGCPMGSLSADMLKEGEPLAHNSQLLFAGPLSWMAQQFRAMGHAGDADDLALQLLSSLQGAMLLTHAFRDPSLLEREGGRLEAWLRSL